MPESLITKTLRKDREIRDAEFGYCLAAWLFGLWGFVRLPNIAILFLPEFSIVQKLYNFSLTIFVLAVAVVAIKRYIELGKIRTKLSENPELASDIKVSGPPILNTIIPFILK